VRNFPVLSWIWNNRDELQVDIRRTPVMKRERGLVESDDQKVGEHDVNEIAAEKKPKKPRGAVGIKAKKRLLIPADLGSRAVSAGMIKSMNQRVILIDDSIGLFKSRDADALWKKFCMNGYVLFRGLLNRDVVLSARQRINALLKKMNHMDEDGKATSKQGWTLDRDSGTVIVGQDEYYKDENNEEEAVKMWKKMAHMREIEVCTVTPSGSNQIATHIKIAIEANMFITSFWLMLCPGYSSEYSSRGGD
jgi:hypothetical protein